jgi:hypothetical protein
MWVPRYDDFKSKAGLALRTHLRMPTAIMSADLWDFCFTRPALVCPLLEMAPNALRGGALFATGLVLTRSEAHAVPARPPGHPRNIAAFIDGRTHGYKFGLLDILTPLLVAIR